MTENINGEAAWLSVKSDIELKIISGDFSADDRIPPIRKIAVIYNIGTTTAAKVLEDLCRDGIIYKRRGIGYFVKPYIKNKLCDEHKKKLEKIIINAFEYADMLNVDVMTIINQIYQEKNS